MLATDPQTPGHILAEWHEGDHEALWALGPVFYEDRHRIAMPCRNGALPGHAFHTAAPAYETSIALEYQ